LSEILFTFARKRPNALSGEAGKPLLFFMLSTSGDAETRVSVSSTLLVCICSKAAGGVV